jgi:hypothetical protein
MGDIEVALVDGEVDRRQTPLVFRRHVSACGDAGLDRGQIVCLYGIEQAAGRVARSLLRRCGCRLLRRNRSCCGERGRHEHARAEHCPREHSATHERNHKDASIAGYGRRHIMPPYSHAHNTGTSRSDPAGGECWAWRRRRAPPMEGLRRLPGAGGESPPSDRRRAGGGTSKRLSERPPCRPQARQKRRNSVLQAPFPRVAWNDQPMFCVHPPELS